MRDAVLLAQKIDLKSARLEGEPTTIVQTVTPISEWATAPASISNHGVLVYAPTLLRRSEMHWYDRKGNILGKVGQPDLWAFGVISPDGRRIAAGKWNARSGTRDIWLIDIARNSESRLTLHPRTEDNALWSPDGKRLVYLSDRRGIYDIFQATVGSGGDEQPVLQTNVDVIPPAFRPTVATCCSHIRIRPRDLTFTLSISLPGKS